MPHTEAVVEKENDGGAESADAQNGSNEPYEPTGVFDDDYQALCSRARIAGAQITRRSNAAAIVPSTGEDAPVTPVPEADFDEQRIVVDYDPEEKGAAREIAVRGWKLDIHNAAVLKALVPSSTRLTTLSFWNAGLTDSTFGAIAEAIPHSTIRVLHLDWNPVSETLYAQLVREDSPLRTLSLRGNGITCEGAKSIAEALKGNRALAILNIWKNRICDAGAVSLAESLKTNRTLLSLSLGRNLIKDPGICAFAEVLSKYALTHDEIVARRKYKTEMEQREGEEQQQETAKPGEKRPPSSKSKNPQASAADLSKKGAKSAEAKDKGAAAKKGAGKEVPLKKVEEKEKPGAKKGAVEDKAGKKSAAPVPDSKSKKKEKSSAGKKRTAEEEREEPEVDYFNPLREPMEEIDGQWFVTGNRTLANLNLSYNRITESGVESLLAALKKDMERVGLLRLSLEGNCASEDSSVIQRLRAFMASRDPTGGPQQSPEEPEVVVEQEAK